MGNEEVHLAELVTGIMLLMLVAATASTINKRMQKLPLTIALVFIGIFLSFASENVPGFHSLAEFELSPDLVLFVFIPTLIFESAFNLNARQLGRNILPILTLAVPGLLLSTAIIGLTLSLFAPFELMVALLLGAILSATDPVAVISIFKQLGVPERLTILVEGESLLNDATSLVLATILIGILTAGTFSGVVVLDGLVNFVVVFLGGAAVGWLLAVAAGLLLGNVESDPAIEITISTILAYFSFIIAEHVFHVSGIMAVVAAGLLMGSWGKSKISPSIEEFMEHFWEYLAYLANALIFLMVGMQIDLVALWQNIDLIGIVPLVGKFPGVEAIGLPYRCVMYWGGLRGAIALAIVLALPPFEYKDTLINVVMGAVLFTLVVQGLTIEVLVKWLRLNEMSLPDNLARIEGDREARVEGLSRLNTLTQGEIFSQRIVDNIQEKSARQIASLTAELQGLHQNMQVEEMRTILAMRCLVREKSRYHQLFSQGLINEWAFRELDHTVDVQLDGVRHKNALPDATIETSIGKRFSQVLMFIMEYVPGLSRPLEQLRTQWIVRDYGVAWGRYRGARSVIEQMNRIAGEEIDREIVTELTQVYQSIQLQVRELIDEVGEQYPEFVEASMEQLGQRLMLIAERDSVEHAAETGILQQGVASKILKDQSERLRVLKQDNMSATFEIEIEELLRKVPAFSKIETERFELIARYLRARTYPRGTDIIRQGGAGDSMFLIARGIANVTIKEGDESKQVATLYAGDFFGESAMLHGTPRNATATAATPCSLYELKGSDLDKICEAHPEIRARVEAIDESRKMSNTHVD